MKTSTCIASASLLALAAAGCSGGERPAPTTGKSEREGVPGVYFLVNVSRPSYGTITSQDGQIACGTGGTACSARFGWTAQAVLTATPDPGYMFGTWVGDCQYTGPCVLDTRLYGSDKFVGARFEPDGQAQHGNFSQPSVHGPAFLDRLAGLPGSFDCTSSRCHGPTYDGLGIAPSCNACHAVEGWTTWLSNCTFCHGERVRSGYSFPADPARAAPPDDVGQRLTGTPTPARTGAHQQHLTGTAGTGEAWTLPFRCETCHPVPADLSHVGGSTSRATVALSGAGQASLPASLGDYDPGSGTCATYCHGSGGAAGTSPAFASTGMACDGCHGVPPPSASGHPAVGGTRSGCAPCHPDTVAADGTILASGGKHVDGVVQVSGCDACHGFPPETGAHVAHFGLVGTETSGYGDTRALQDMFPGETPTGAPAVYAFGCGACHPLDSSVHDDGVADVVLHEAAAPAGSLKRLSPPTAAYDRAAGTCSDVYCHSSGQAAPTYRTTPAWTSGAALACDGCHDNPPRYRSGGAGAATANSHLDYDVWGPDFGWETGHYSGLPGPCHGGGSKHGGGSPDFPLDAHQAASPITCQACHADTVDPANVAPGGFFWLDTTGDYHLPAGDAGRVGTATWLATQCSSCHTEGGPAPVMAGRVLPLRHVNGTRDVVFDARPALGAGLAGSLPPIPVPFRPYYVTYFNLTIQGWQIPVDAELVSTAAAAKPVYTTTLEHAAYDPATKTCSNVGCHVGRQSLVEAGIIEPLRWGAPYDSFGTTCAGCHNYSY